MRGIEVVVSAAGLQCSLGPDAGTACAAARAGVMRISSTSALSRDPVSGEMVAVGAHQAVHPTHGFVGAARLCRLFVPALRDALQQADLTVRDLKSIPLFLCTSDRFLIRCAAARPQQDGYLADKIEPDDLEVDITEKITSSLFSILSRSLEAEFHSQGRIFRGDHATALEVLRDAGGLIARGESRRCLVGAVDSLVEPQALQAVLDLDLVSTPATGQGMIPGEAGAVLLLEATPDAARSGARELGRLAPYGSASEPVHRFSEVATQGEALRQALDQLLAGMPEGEEIATIFSDLNGDSWRAQEWGLALVAVGNVHGLHSAKVRHPAASIGDVGAATSLASISMAMRSFQRGYADGPNALILASSYSGRKAAVMCRQAA